MHGLEHQIHHHHDPILIILSVVIAMFASYVALDLANSITVAKGRARLAWLTGGSLAMGVGIWSMHFVGMLAFSLPGIPIAYDVPLLILSIVVAIFASALALYIVSNEQITNLSYSLGSLAMGGAIVGMHYIGIASMRLSADYEWNFGLVAASVAIALVASFVALWLAFRLRADMSTRGFWYRGLGGAVMGFAIAGMHYTAMAAMIFYPGKPLRLEAEQLLATDGLATAVICTSLLIMGIALTGSIVDRALARREAMTEQITRILESITDGFFSVDRDWNFTYANRVAHDIFLTLGSAGISAVKGLNLWETLPSLRQTKFEKEYRRAMSTGKTVRTVEFFEPLERWFEARAYPSANGLSVYFRDVTDQKLAEETIHQAREAAESATNAKSQFIANISHEIRTPLGVILGFAELANHPKVSPDERERYLSGIIRNAKELSKLIGDVLDLSKVEADKLDIEMTTFSISALVKEVVDAFRLPSQERAVDLSFSISDSVPEKVTTDCLRVRQILMNLVGNAIKFTEQGKVEIKVLDRGTATEKNLHQIGFEVTDTGVGLTEEQAENLFKPFSQADSSTTRKFGGTGLGLALSRRLARAIGGDLWLKESIPNKGSTFSFFIYDFRDEFSDEVLTGLKSFEMESLEDTSILLVDDSADNRLVVQHLLARSGAQVECAANGEEGVQMALAKGFDIVLMDIQMPEMDGFEATAELRQKGYKSPILALTAHAMKEERERALRSGFDAYLTKPIDHKRLVETILNLRFKTR